MCLIASFIRANYAPENDDQEFQGTYSVQTTALDDKSFNILDQANGGFSIDNPAENGYPFDLVFKFEFSEVFVAQKAAVTYCMSNVPGAGEPWENNDNCKAVQNIDAGTIQCNCDTLYDRYYAIITEGTAGDSQGSGLEEERSNVVFILLLILLIVILLIVVLLLVLLVVLHQ